MLWWGKKKVRKKKYEEILKKNGGYLDSIFLGDNRVGKTSLIKRIEKKNLIKMKNILILLMKLHLNIKIIK